MPFLQDTTFNHILDKLYPKARSRMEIFGLKGGARRAPKRSRGEIDVLGAMPERFYRLVMTVLGSEESNPGKNGGNMPQAEAYVRGRVEELFAWASKGRRQQTAE